MAVGIELILGFPQPQWDKLGLDLPPFCNGDSDNDSPDYDDRAFSAVFEPFQEPLRLAHLAALKEKGFKPSKSKKEPKRREGARDRYEWFDTPLGPREFSTWNLGIEYDPGEMGEQPSDATIGVHISSRYFPCFADWRDAHGTLTPMIFDEDLQNTMEIAKRHIVEACPPLKDAYWIVKELHY